jgi:hypothetical protein
MVYGTPVPGSIACNDVWSNNRGNYGGDSPDLTGIDGNISADPLFCNAQARDYTLDARSPCAPEHSPPGCGLIGAWPVVCGVTAVDDPARSPRFHLAAHPNPVRRGATFTFDAGGGAGSLEIIDSQGRLVTALPAAGRQSLRWNPSRLVPAGVYFARLTGSRARTETVKIVVLR